MNLEDTLKELEELEKVFNSRRESWMDELPHEYARSFVNDPNETW